MHETEKQEDIVAMIGALSAVDLHLQRVEQTARDRSRVVLDEARSADVATQAQYEMVGHLLQDVHADLRRLRERIDRLESFLRSEGRGDAAQNRRVG